jgi:hypothetical protein
MNVMNTRDHNGRGAALATLVLALALPLAACQTPVASSEVPAAPAQLKVREAPAPAAHPSPSPAPTPAPTAAPTVRTRTQCIADYIEKGFDATGVAQALCGGGGLRAR